MQMKRRQITFKCSVIRHGLIVLSSLLHTPSRGHIKNWETWTNIQCSINRQLPPEISTNLPTEPTITTCHHLSVRNGLTDCRVIAELFAVLKKLICVPSQIGFTSIFFENVDNNSDMGRRKAEEALEILIPPRSMHWLVIKTNIKHLSVAPNLNIWLNLLWGLQKCDLLIYFGTKHHHHYHRLFSQEGR